jgi:hypothetical protein
VVNIVLYTAVFGNIDRLWTVWAGDSAARFVAIVDSRKQETGHWRDDKGLHLREAASLPRWEQVIVNPKYGNRRTARHFKTMPHKYFPEADYWIWVDGNVRPKYTPEEMVEMWLPSNRRLAAFKHPDRKDLYEEARACKRFKKDTWDTLGSQVGKYRKEGHPKGYGLAETKVVIRRNDPKVHRMNSMWWKEILNHSVRDQVSLPYVCWKLNMEWAIIPGRCDRSNEFVHIKHTKGR